jgi:hypothetical protein
MLLRQQGRSNTFGMSAGGSNHECGGYQKRLCETRNEQDFLPEL